MARYVATIAATSGSHPRSIARYGQVLDWGLGRLTPLRRSALTSGHLLGEAEVAHAAIPVRQPCWQLDGSQHLITMRQALASPVPSLNGGILFANNRNGQPTQLRLPVNGVYRRDFFFTTEIRTNAGVTAPCIVEAFGMVNPH